MRVGWRKVYLVGVYIRIAAVLVEIDDPFLILILILTLILTLILIQLALHGQKQHPLFQRHFNWLAVIQLADKLELIARARDLPLYAIGACGNGTTRTLKLISIVVFNDVVLIWLE